MISTLRYIVLILIPSAFLTIYLIVLTSPENQRRYVAHLKNKSAPKEIVAYSLRKQIEIESEEFFCGNELAAGGLLPENLNILELEPWTKIAHTNLYVFDVYEDDRLKPYLYARFLGMVKGVSSQPIYCQTVSSTGKHHITKATKTSIWSKNWNKIGENYSFNPVLISCLLPSTFVAKHIALSSQPCSFTNNYFNIKLFETTKPKISFTICVKPLDFSEDISARLIQWIEINRILGANKFEIYVRSVNAKVRKTLKFYESMYKEEFFVRDHQYVEDYFKERGKGIFDDVADVSISKREGDVVRIKRRNGAKCYACGEDGFTTVDEQTVRRRTVKISEQFKGIWQKRRNELIPYNDCLYRNLHASHFVIPVDIDEIIIPRQFHTWQGLLGQLLASDSPLLNNSASFSVTNAYFMEQFAPERSTEPVFFFKYTTRSQLSEKNESGKSFVNTKNTLTVFNHYALHALKPGIEKVHYLPEEVVQMNHYKRTCSVQLLPQCAKYLNSTVRVVDNISRKYRKEFARNYEQILEQLQRFYGLASSFI